MVQSWVRALVIVGLALGCGASDPGGPEGALDPEPTGALPPGEDFGAPLTLSEVADFREVVTHPESYRDQPVLIRAKVYEVCQRKGCWMTLGEGDSRVRVRFKDYGFFVPKGCSGKVAYAQGRVKAEVIPEKTARHYAEESQSEDPSSIRGPRREVSFVAAGVRLIAPN